MLTEKQQEIFDIFLHMIEMKKNYFLSSEDRGIGKTYTLNELAFTLQALGYKVFILTPFRNQEYFGERFISLDKMDYQERLREDAVVIADETRYEMMGDFLDYCEYRKIPVIGYVNFRISKSIEPIEFIKEYECNWIK